MSPPADVLRAAREAAASVADRRIRWLYLSGHCDHFTIVQACCAALARERAERPEAARVDTGTGRLPA